MFFWKERGRRHLFQNCFLTPLLTLFPPDFRATLLALTRDLLHNYIDLTDALARRPSAYGRCVEAVGACARNAAFLLNALRPRQAAAGVAAALEDDAKRWNEEAERLEAAVAAHDAAVEAAAREMEKAV